MAVPAYAAGSDDSADPTLWDGIVSFFTGEATEDSAETSSEISLYAAGNKGTDVADASTLDGWNAILESGGQATTQNIGRIWTDKSVFTDGASFTKGPLAVVCQHVVYIPGMTDRDGPLRCKPEQLTACGSHPYLSPSGRKQRLGTEQLAYRRRRNK